MDYQRHYEGFYADGPDGRRLQTWRRLGAVGKAANLVAMAAPWPHASILEIGAGDGAVLERLVELGFGERLYALEISASGVEAIRRRAIPALVECRRFDGAHLPYGDGAFDLAVLTHVLEHVEYPRQLLYEAARVARTVFVEVPLEDNLRLKPDFVWDAVGHINAYSPKTIRRLVQTCGLRVLEQRTTNPPLEAYVFRAGLRGRFGYWAKEVLLRLHAGLATRLFTYHGALVATREPVAGGEGEAAKLSGRHVERSGT